MSSRTKLVGLLAGTLFAISAAGCGEDSQTEEPENPNAEACEHMGMGPGVDLTAAAMSSATAPEIDNDHKRYDVTTAVVSGSKGGFVTFAPAAAGDYILFTSQAVTLSVKDAGGTEVAAKASAASITECTLVKGRHVYPLQVGTYVVGITGTVDKVSFVIEAAE